MGLDKDIESGVDSPLPRTSSDIDVMTGLGLIENQFNLLECTLDRLSDLVLAAASGDQGALKIAAVIAGSWKDSRRPVQAESQTVAEDSTG